MPIFFMLQKINISIKVLFDIETTPFTAYLDKNIDEKQFLLS